MRIHHRIDCASNDISRVPFSPEDVSAAVAREQKYALDEQAQQQRIARRTAAIMLLRTEARSNPTVAAILALIGENRADD